MRAGSHLLVRPRTFAAHFDAVGVARPLEKQPRRQVLAVRRAESLPTNLNAGAEEDAASGFEVTAVAYPLFHNMVVCLERRRTPVTLRAAALR
jgi:hypothetical protein